MAKKTFTLGPTEDNVPASDAAPVEAEAFATEQPAADSERHAEDATGATNEAGHPVVLDPEPADNQAEAGEKPGRGGQFVSLGNGRVRRV